MAVTNRRTRVRPLRLVLAAVAGLALAAGTWWSPLDRVLVWHWRVRLVTADDGHAARIVERIAAQGEFGLDALAALLGSARTSVVEAARDSIREEIGRWPALDADVRQRRSLRLAQALAAQVEQYNPAARRIASAFVVQILREEDAILSDERQDLVAACDRVLRACVLERRQALLARAERTATLGDDLSPHARAVLEGDPAAALWLKSPPGGGLPLGVVGSQSPPPDQQDLRADDKSDERARDTDSGEPGRLGAEAAANEAAHPITPSIDDDPRLIPADSSKSANDQPPGADPTDTLRWMHALHSGDLELRARAEEELTRQGFEALQLELARQLTDPNPRVRRELAESLPAMPGIDAHVWLVWLSRDEHADVRLAAMSVMATTADPNVIRRIEQMARTDVDPRVQRQGEKLLGLREAEHHTSGRHRKAQ
jgi:hypothetical protein